MENDTWISDLESCGWLDELAKEDLPELKKRLECDPRDLGYLHLASLIINDPERLAGGSRLLDPASEDEICSYEELMMAYASASQGHFSPEAIVEEINDEEGHFAIGFLASGRIHAIFVPGSPHFDIELNDMVNESLAADGCRKRFFVLPTEDEKVALAFVSPPVFEQARRMGLVPEGEPTSSSSGDFLSEFEFEDSPPPEAGNGKRDTMPGIGREADELLPA